MGLGYCLGLGIVLTLGAFACSGTDRANGRGEEREGPIVSYLPQGRPGWEGMLLFQNAEVIARDRRAECYREARGPVDGARLVQGEQLFASGAPWLKVARRLIDAVDPAPSSNPSSSSAQNVPRGGVETNSDTDIGPIVAEMPSVEFATPCGVDIGMPSDESRPSSVVVVNTTNSHWVPGTAYYFDAAVNDPDALELLAFLDQLFPKDW
jgi:hypothetical protein